MHVKPNDSPVYAPGKRNPYEKWRLLERFAGHRFGFLLVIPLMFLAAMIVILGSNRQL
jgi:hypothetical protein